MKKLTLLIVWILISCSNNIDEEMKLFQALAEYDVIDKWGIPADGEVLASDKLQEVINDNVGTNIDLNGSYLIDKPVIVPTGTMLEINGKIKMDAAIIKDVVSDVADGSNTIYIANADQYYKVGQTIAITDDRYVFTPNSPAARTIMAQSNIVAEVYSDRIVCEQNFTNSDHAGYLVSENAKVGHYNGGFLFEEVSNITITGTGELDGNLANQWNTIYAVEYDRRAEAVLDGSAMGFTGVDNININGSNVADKLYIHDWMMHGCGSITTRANIKNTNSSFSNIEFDGCFEKSWQGWGWYDSVVHHIKNINGIREGEIILYTANGRVDIYDIESSGNGRFGVSINAAAIDCTMKRITATNNVAHFSTSPNIAIGVNTDSVCEDLIVDGGTSEAYGFEAKGSTNPSIDGLQIKNGTYLRRGVSIDTVTGITILDLDIDDVDGSNCSLGYATAILFDDSTNVVIDGFDINNVDYVFDVLNAGQTITLKNGTINNYNTLYKNNNSAITFINVWDAQQGIYL